MTTEHFGIDGILHASPGVKVACIAAFASLFASVFTFFAAVLSNPIKYWFDNRALDAKLRVEYQSKNLTDLHDLMRRYKGLLVESGEGLNLRMWNLYKHESELNVAGVYQNSTYYFRTTVRRLTLVLSTATAFEDESAYLDPTVALDDDYQFIYMLKSWPYVLTNLNLFDGVSHIIDIQHDHLFRDTLRCIGEKTWIEKKFVAEDVLEDLMVNDRDVRSLCSFLDGLNSSEDRLRWDRLVCFHMLLMIFLNTFGYPIHRTPKEKLAIVIRKINHEQIRKNLAALLERYQLLQSPAGKDVHELLKESFSGN